MILSDTRYKVEVKGFITENFEVRTGLRQGYPLSVVRESGIEMKKKIIQKPSTCRLWMILARNDKELTEPFRKLEKAEKVWFEDKLQQDKVYWFKYTTKK